MRSDNDMRSASTWEITVDSDWFTTLGAVVLLVLSALLLVREIDHFVWGRLSLPVPLRISFWIIWNKIFEAIAAIFCFVFAFKLANKYLKTASALMGMNLAGFVLFSCFPISPRALHVVALSGSVMRQIALVTFCVALAQWLKSVVRWGPQTELTGGGN